MGDELSTSRKNKSRCRMRTSEVHQRGRLTETQESENMGQRENRQPEEKRGKSRVGSGSRWRQSARMVLMSHKYTPPRYPP